MPTYTSADGFLRLGADIQYALYRSDGLLYLAGPGTGGVLGTPKVWLPTGVLLTTSETLAVLSAYASEASISPYMSVVSLDSKVRAAILEAWKASPNLEQYEARAAIEGLSSKALLTTLATLTTLSARTSEVGIDPKAQAAALAAWRASMGLEEHEVDAAISSNLSNVVLLTSE